MDLLRLVAALGVVIHHWNGEPEAAAWAFPQLRGVPYEWLREVGLHSGTGVILFFVLSGTVIAQSAMHKTPRQFLAARAARLVPSLAMSSLVVTLLIWLSPYSVVDAMSLGHVVLGWLLLNYPLETPALSGVYWTLWLEVKFYLLIALVMLVVPLSRRVLTTVACAWIAVLAVVSVINEGAVLPKLLREVLMPDVGALFAAGILIAMARSNAERAGAAVLALGAGLLTGATVPLQAGVSRVAVEIRALGSVVAVAAAAWLPCPRVLASGAVAALGKMTYPIYLFEGAPALALLRWAGVHGLAPMAAIALTFAAVMAIAWVITRFVDPPAARWIRVLLDPTSRQSRPRGGAAAQQ